MEFLIRAIHTRGSGNLLKRSLRILSRYGTNFHKIQRCLRLYAEVLSNFGCNATLPICGFIVKRYPRLVHEAAQLGYEIACHGFTHVDHANLTLDQQVSSLRRSLYEFQRIGVDINGFRVPYLSFNSKTLAAAHNVGMRYISNEGIMWDVIKTQSTAEGQLQAYLRAMRMYHPNMAKDQPSLPKLLDGVVSIPVSLPDDELIVDRLGIKSSERISEIWHDILNMSYERGELFTLMLHPERINVCRAALLGLLENASAREPKVWVATLNEIAQWWRERSAFNFVVKKQGGSTIMQLKCPERATILVKDMAGPFTGGQLHGSYRIVSAHDIHIEGNRIPVLGLADDVDESTAWDLSQEGFFLERCNDGSKYSFCLDADRIGSRSISEIVEMLNGTEAPLVRLWRWPNGARSAMAVTGDVDAASIADYLFRVLRK